MSYLRPRSSLQHRPLPQMQRPGLRNNSGSSQYLGNFGNQPKEDLLKQEPARPSYMDSSSDESVSASFFLKKPINDEENEDEISNKKNFAEETKIPNKSSENLRPKTSSGMQEKATTSYHGSDAMARFAELENRIKARAKESQAMSLSLSDLDISTDSEIKRDVKQLRKQRTSKTTSTKIFLIKKSLSSSSSSESEKIDFIKRDMPSKSVTSASVDETFESKRKTVSFAANLVQTSQDASLDEFLPSHHSNDDISLDEFLPKSSLQNIMTLDDLEPAEGSALDFSRIHSVDELLPAAQQSSDGTDSVSSYDPGKSFSNIRSIDDLESVASESEDTKTPVKNKPQPQLQTNIFKPARKEDSVSSIEDVVEDDVAEEVEEIEDEYTSEFNTDEDDTLKDTESITHDVSSIKESSQSVASTISSESETQSKQTTNTPSYTETFESDTSATESDSTVLKPATVKTETAVQTEPVDIHAKDDPFKGIAFSPVFPPTLVVSNEALAALTSYSPATLALQDMMKRQLALTKDFIERSERLHQSTMSSLTPNYHYTTLEETKQIINAHRKKRNLPPRV
nr:uncharacterized protein C19orf44 isoform X2 [Ciona intestinalis]|eukprot:XP_009859284.1 uncharacterized protein C19orf44 isoform X2 [Ciona intestinalis]